MDAFIVARAALNVDTFVDDVNRNKSLFPNDRLIYKV